MGVRRQGRIAAVQILYQMDARASFDDLTGTIQRHFDHVDPDASPEVRAFAVQLCEGVLEHLADLDELIDATSHNWRVARMSWVDRNVLRLGAYELLHGGTVPVNVAIDEAVEIGKAFGATETSGFVNGVLARLAQQLKSG